MIFVSLCIPTKDRLKYLKETIESVILDVENFNDFEIVISDNSDTNETHDYAKELQKNGVNVIYYKNPKKGFYNSIEALKKGNGALLKLHNDYSKFKKGAFNKIVEYAKENVSDKPVIFYSNGTLKLKTNITYFNNKNKFIKSTNYQNTWSSAFSIWKEQLKNIPHSPDDVDNMFPHTSLLFHVSCDNYVIDNTKYIDNISVEKKGGYNIFYNFCILYLNMLNNLVTSAEISRLTFLYIKYSMFFKFIIPWYYKTIYTNQGFTFDPSNADENIKKKYGSIGMLLIKSLCFVRKKYKNEE
ncbi:TPA: glycosyltransferase [Morganella morganii]